MKLEHNYYGNDNDGDEKEERKKGRHREDLQFVLKFLIFIIHVDVSRIFLYVMFILIYAGI